MRPGGGKSKGNTFERTAARALSGWLTDGADPNQLIWSVGSGGWRSKEDGTQGWRQVGDLAPNGEAGERFRRLFAVECKHVSEIDFWHTFTAAPGENLHGWWLKLKSQCEPYPGLQPMLVVRMNRRPTMVGCEGLDLMSPAIIVRYGDEHIPFVELDDFLTLDVEWVFDLRK